MMATARAMVTKEVRQIVRDRRTLLILVFVPAFFLLLYGYALNFDIRNIALAVEDQDGSPASRELVSAFVNSGYFTYAGPAHSGRDLEAMIDRDQARAALVIPANYSSDLQRRVPVRVQVIVNGDNANTASAVVGYASAIIGDAGAALVARTTGQSPQALVGFEPRVWYNPQLRSTLFLVPGLIAYISMITAVISTALAVVREKERGTMEQIRMAPVEPAGVRDRQDGAVLGDRVRLGAAHHPGEHGALRPAAARLVVAAVPVDRPVPHRRAGAGAAHLHRGADAAGGVPAGAALELPAHVHPLRLHLPDHQHAGGGAGHHLRRAGALLPGGAAQRRAEGREHLVFWQDLVALAIFATVVLGLSALRLRREWA